MESVRVTRSSLSRRETTLLDKENASLSEAKKIKRKSKRGKVAEEQKKIGESKTGQKVEKRQEENPAKIVIRPRKHFTQHEFLIDDPPLTTQNRQRITRSYSLDSRKSQAPSNDLADTFKSSLVLDKDEFCLTSTEPYYISRDIQIPTIHPLPQTETQVELPKWRILEIKPIKRRTVKRKKQKIDAMILEDLGLERRGKYHNKLELQEKRVSAEFLKNRQMRQKREKEQKLKRKKIYEKYRRCIANGHEYVNSDSEIDMANIILEFDENKIRQEMEENTITEMNGEIKKIRIKENIPISAFGELLPAFKNREFGIKFHQRPDSPTLPF